MTDRIVLVVGAVLGVGSLVVAAILIRPRPASWREMLYLALPLAGAAVLAGLSWSHL